MQVKKSTLTVKISCLNKEREGLTLFDKMTCFELLVEPEVEATGEAVDQSDPCGEL